MTDITAPRPTYQKALRSAVKAQIRKAVESQWEHEWNTNATGRHLFELTPSPTKNVLKTHKGLHRALSTIIVQMRTGKIGLRHYLYRRGVPEFPDDGCSCGRGSQTTRHVLFAYHLFNELREEIFKRRTGGPDGEGRFQTVLNTPKLARHFLASTIVPA